MLETEVHEMNVDVLTAGLSIPAYQLSAMNRFVAQAKAHGYWGNLLEVYPFAGREVATAMYKLKVAPGLVRLMTWHYVPWALDDTSFSERGGLKGDTQAALKTGFIAEDHLVSTSNGMVSFAVNNSYPVTHGSAIGGITNGALSMTMTTGNQIQARIHSNNAAQTTDPVPRQQGFYVGNRDNTTANVTIHKNGVLLIDAVLAVSEALDDSECYLLARNSAGTAQNTIKSPVLFAGYGDIFTTAKVVAYSEDVLDFLRDMRRGT